MAAVAVAAARGGFGGGKGGMVQPRMAHGKGAAAAPMPMAACAMANGGSAMDAKQWTPRHGVPTKPAGSRGGAAPMVQPTIRTKFADTALWVGQLTTESNGTAEVELNMPENLTTWRIKAWGMGFGTRVGQGQTDVVTRKDLIVRLEAPRFFVQTDEVVLSAVVHNYLKTKKSVKSRWNWGQDAGTVREGTSRSQAGHPDQLNARQDVPTPPSKSPPRARPASIGG